MEYYPVLITVYDRIEHLKQCISSLLMNKEAPFTDVYIASDEAYRLEDREIIEEIRRYVLEIKGFKSVNLLKRSSNLGPNKNIELAFKEVFSIKDALIFMEDDNVVSNFFLKFMNRCLSNFKDNKEIYCVCGYMYPIEDTCLDKAGLIKHQDFNAWGYGIWKSKYYNYNKYDRSDLKKDKLTLSKMKKISNVSYHILLSDIIHNKTYGDGRICYHLVRNNLFSIFPSKSLVKNIGHDGSGVNCGTNSILQDQKFSFNTQIFCSFDEVNYNYTVSSVISKYRSYSKWRNFVINVRRLFKRIKNEYFK